MNITRELKKLELMALYATALVNNKGREKIKSADMYQPLLKSAYLSVKVFENNLSWGACTRLDKEVDGRLIYITLAEWEKLNESQVYSWYELKAEIDQCRVIIKLKRKIRAMIKSPESFSTIDY